MKCFDIFVLLRNIVSNVIMTGWKIENCFVPIQYTRTFPAAALCALFGHVYILAETPSSFTCVIIAML